ncbi:MAG: ADP-ribosylglycohydrolase family protein, partial [Myxococcales bacterium]|nr:ADP-ribosylglycohydrolase family protein [Myxococcales bacterium]
GLPAGVGLGTLRAILKLWVGFGADRSGVWSAGNGPAMRAPIIGAYASGDRALREELVRASTRVTHADPKAEQGARAVAAVAAYACGCGGELDATAVLARACDEVDDEELRGRLLVARDMVGRPTHEVVRRWDLGEGITGYIYDTVPAVLHCWTRHRGAIEPALQEIVECGGDTDTTGAILGGLAGATHGVGGIPEDWRGGIVAWPRSVSWMTRLGEALATGAKAPRYFLPGTLLRNAAFLIAVYGQIVRRAFPPY